MEREEIEEGQMVKMFEGASEEAKRSWHGKTRYDLCISVHLCGYLWGGDW